jgi:predicted nuclease of predicted toxin-antitoxin system
MKLLFDQNVSFELVSLVAPIFPDSKHVKDFELTRVRDDAIWAFAAENGFAIVSKDSDFVHRALLRGHPPKLVYVRVGNASTERIGQLLLGSQDAIKNFLSDPVESVLTLE